MLPALVAEVVQYDGGMFSQLVTVLLLAVQDTQGIALQTVLTGGAQLIIVGGVVVLQCLLELGTAVGTANGVDEQTDLLHSQGIQCLLYWWNSR